VGDHLAGVTSPQGKAHRLAWLSILDVADDRIGRDGKVFAQSAAGNLRRVHVELAATH
jgi:hypothetical protein